MRYFRPFGSAFALVLVASLCLPALASAGEAERADRGSGTGGIASQVWTWLEGLWLKEGCLIDPNGRCTPGEATLPRAESPNSDEESALRLKSARRFDLKRKAWLLENATSVGVESVRGQRSVL